VSKAALAMLDAAATNAKGRGSFERLRAPALALPGLFLALLVLISVITPLVLPDAPFQQHLSEALAGPSSAHPLGTDELGRDLLSRLILGTRISFEVGFGSTAVALAIGGLLGLWSGYSENPVGAVIMRLSDVLLAFPSILLAMLVVTVMRTDLPGVIVAVALVNIPVFVRLNRALMLSQRRLEYVEAAKALGGSTSYVILRAVLPNVLAPLAVQSALAIANAVLLEAGLSFLGLGVQPPTPSLGLELQEAAAYLRQDAWFGIFPGLLLILIVLALNKLADEGARWYGRTDLKVE